MDPTPGGEPLTRALDAAVVQADSHGDPARARKILAGALRRAAGTDRTVPPGTGLPLPELARALANLVELCVRTGDGAAARSAYAQLTDLAAGDGTEAIRSADDRVTIDAALIEAHAVLPSP